jgi:hypothetical protein
MNPKKKKTPKINTEKTSKDPEDEEKNEIKLKPINQYQQNLKIQKIRRKMKIK